ncbi:unnamed protein product [Cylicocyclus nassatus]|uniref:Uncharacterized protein n=1 Tax=Cylicocyclus nassatus TaxID=53992 RepID=A0AA36HFH8_CYLNA|nr:unnamed protein product [Cylicocyclus nassatus]
MWKFTSVDEHRYAAVRGSQPNRGMTAAAERRHLRTRGCTLYCASMFDGYDIHRYMLLKIRAKTAVRANE